MPPFWLDACDKQCKVDQFMRCVQLVDPTHRPTLSCMAKASLHLLGTSTVLQLLANLVLLLRFITQDMQDSIAS